LVQVELIKIHEIQVAAKFWVFPVLGPAEIDSS